MSKYETNYIDSDSSCNEENKRREDSPSEFKKSKMTKHCSKNKENNDLCININERDDE